MSGPTGPLLDGVRVVDLSRVLAGPFAAQVLGEMGADVVKVEGPEGDPSRGIGPHRNGMSLYYASLNTNKRGVVLDLSSAAGRDALAHLLATADIVVENFRPDAARKLECDPATLLGRHPHLVVVTVSGYARDSARAADPALDVTVQAESGIMSVTGEPGGRPVRAGVPVGDLAAGLWGALGAVAGYTARLRHGVGRHVEVPLFDATLTLLSYVATAAAATGADPAPVGSGHHSVVPYGAYPTADGWIVIAVIGDKFWPLVCRALDLDGPGGSGALATNAQRAAAREEVDALLAARLADLTTAEVQARLRAVGVPHAPVNTVLGALTGAYVNERGIVGDVATEAGPYRVVQGPLRGGGTPRPAPRLGEHTEAVMREVLGDGSPLLAAVLRSQPDARR